MQRLHRDQYERARGLQVAPDQLAFTGTVSEALRGAGDARHPYGIWQGRSLVGFFIVDTQFDRAFDFCDTGELGIRTFLIDSRRQGQGLGKAAVKALALHLANAYPASGTVWLTVNCRNQAAYRCYELGGFSDTGNLYLGGEAGPQHVMSLRLQSQSSRCS